MEFLFTDTVDSISAVPEQYRPLYVEKDGKHRLIDDPKVKPATEGLVALGKALKAAREEAGDYKKKIVDLSPLKEFGESPQEIVSSFKTKLEELTDQVAQGSKAKLDLDKVKQDLSKGHATELAAKDKRIEALTNQLHSLLIENTATEAIAKEKGDAALLMPHVLKRVKAIEEDGAVKVKVVDDKNAIRFSPTSGNEMTIVELVREMKNDKSYGKLFESEAPRGGGLRPGSTQRKVESVSSGEKSPIDKIRAGLARKS